MSLPNKYLKSTCYWDLMSDFRTCPGCRPIIEGLDPVSPVRVYANGCGCVSGGCNRCTSTAISLGMYNSCPNCGLSLSLPSSIAPYGDRTEHECKCGAVLYICNGTARFGPSDSNVKIVTAAILNAQDEDVI